MVDRLRLCAAGLLTSVFTLCNMQGRRWRQGQQRGRGVEDDLSLAQLTARRPTLELDPELKSLSKLVTITDHRISDVQPIGSATYRLYKVFSDVDLNDRIDIQAQPGQVAEQFAGQIQQLVQHMRRSEHPRVFFSDFKTTDTTGDQMYHWSAKEILAGVNRTGMTLQQALNQNGFVKLDMIAPYQGQRYLELSTVFIVTAHPDGHTSIPLTHELSLNVQLLKDMARYSTPGPEYDMFKAMKRVWSWAANTQNATLVRQVAPLLRSDLASLSQIAASFKTLALLYSREDVNRDIDLKVALTQVSDAEFRLSAVLDPALDFPYLKSLLDQLRVLIGQNETSDKGQIVTLAKRLAATLNELVNRQTAEYVTRHNIVFPT